MALGATNINIWTFRALFYMIINDNIGWGRVILGQGNSGTGRAILDKKYFHQVKQNIWPKNYRNIVGRHPLHVPVALELWRVLW